MRNNFSASVENFGSDDFEKTQTATTEIDPFFEELTDEQLENEVEEFEEAERVATDTFVGYYRLPCFIHLLQLVVRKFDTIKEFHRLIKKATKLVSSFNKSGNTTARLIQMAGVKLIGDVKTRWNSTYLMLAR